MKILPAVLMITAALMLSQCRKSPVVPDGIVDFSVSYEVDGQELIFDTILYMNDAGNQYSVSRLEYLVSSFAFHHSDGNTILLDSIFYCNARTAPTNQWMAVGLPEGNYTGFSFYLGLQGEDNKSNSLPNTPGFNNMEWPEPMGGGYHFLKLEGHYLNDDGIQGFAMHLGENPNEIFVKIDYPFEVIDRVDIPLKMNINEWFTNPKTYDFEIDGNYSMGLGPPMQKLSQNGHNIFSIDQ